MSSNKTLSAIVANKIENQIICGNWQVGSQIPPEQELMQTFDVSRITIREAIKNAGVSGRSGNPPWLRHFCQRRAGPV